MARRSSTAILMLLTSVAVAAIVAGCVSGPSGNNTTARLLNTSGGGSAGASPGLSLTMPGASHELGGDVVPVPMPTPGTCPAPAQKPAQEVIVTHADAPPEETVYANNGDIIHLSLAENPSTGYSWQLTWTGGLDKIDDRYVQGSTSAGGHPILGAGGVHEWTFRATRPGPQKVSGIYKRPWESTSTDERTYTLNVAVT